MRCGAKSKNLFLLYWYIKSVQKGITTEINIRLDVAVKIILLHHSEFIMTLAFI